jgi:pimeloyl-ACP methyl ester carboxylesterase
VLLASPGRDPGAFLPAQPLGRHFWRATIELNRRAPLAMKLAYGLVKPSLTSPLILGAIREIVRHTGFNPKLARTDDIEEYVGKVLEVDPNLFYDMAGELESFDVAKIGAGITCPALVIAGGDDQIVPIAEARRLAKHLPASELMIVPHGSHCPHFDDPPLVNGLIEAFLAKHGL